MFVLENYFAKSSVFSHRLRSNKILEFSNLNPVVYAAHGKGKGKEMHKVILPPTVQRNLVTTVRNKAILSKNVLFSLRIVKLTLFKL
jgi:hypothetical protein